MLYTTALRFCIEKYEQSIRKVSYPKHKEGELRVRKEKLLSHVDTVSSLSTQLFMYSLGCMVYIVDGSFLFVQLIRVIE